MKMKFVAILLSVLVISMTPVFAAQMNLTYDANGNKVSGDDGTYRVYNSLNQLWRVYNGSSSGTLLQEYTYHPTEERVWAKKDFYPNGSVQQTTIYFDKNHVRIINASGSFDTLYIYDDGQLIAQKNSDGTTYFIVDDNIGSSTLVTNSSGAVIENDTYTPFGQQLSSSVVRYGYEAKEQDSILGDTDFNFRKYNSNTALFEQPDSFLPTVYDPQQVSRYSFKRNNPYSTIDENGHWAVNYNINFGTDQLIFGVSGGIGVAVSDDPSTGFQAGITTTESGGLRYGESDSLIVDRTSDPSGDSINEFAGHSVSAGGLICFVFCGHYEKSEDEDTPSPTQTTAGLGSGVGIQVYATGSQTQVITLISIPGNSNNAGTVNNGASQVDTSTNTNKQTAQKPKLENSATPSTSALNDPNHSTYHDASGNPIYVGATHHS